MALLIVIAVTMGICVVMSQRSAASRLTLRIVIAVVLMLATIYLGFFAFLFASLSGSEEFMISFAIVTIVLYFLTPLSILALLSKKRLIISWASLTGFFVLVVGCSTAYHHYDSSFEVIHADNILMYQYNPASEDNILAKLDEPASFRVIAGLSMDGATALYPLYAAFAQAIYDVDKNYPPDIYDLYSMESLVTCSTTPEAYRRLINSEVDMIFVAEASEEQKVAAIEQGKELEFIPIGKEAFVFFVNIDNNIDGLSQEQIRDIYSGKITNWRELGGSDRDIIPFQRDEESGSQSAFLRLMNDRELITPRMGKKPSDMGGMVDAVADYKNYPSAIGYSFRYFLQEMAPDSRVKLLEVDGVYPSLENIRNGSYPLADYFYAVVDKNNPNPNIRPMLDWILSEQGRELIEKTGYVAIGQ